MCRSRYWLDLKGYDPAAAAKQLGIPMLILQGERDFQVDDDGFRVVEGRGWGSAKGVAMKSYPALNHLFVAGRGEEHCRRIQQAGPCRARRSSTTSPTFVKP